MFDVSTEFGARVVHRLQNDYIIWLTTVRADGTPQPSPIWFLWADETIIFYSKPDTPKIRNITPNPRVALNFDGDGQGGNIVVFTGEAAIDQQIPPANQFSVYLTKYGEGMTTRLGMSPAQLAQIYAIPVRVTLLRIRGH
ncbi:MAG: TIGR03667 family PPOX class F420-dependent oxidoreductase [Chloroflexi bacterium AL-W]|nr:TIGR03667 family PPOX class F420-dependent oxidoreductase [Chloroflexi bacterium AL-N1]NOK70574.1 TIGR03667 family PPOX class F420-dependent oxidoreductase [Chloroflexi bacterium AL-N10]NOK77566.1 TIGR03667 family PPOX class F420-dependent oxidoreductase [Chloroflexi bacterium AL-N5]NOK84417.1 TIGR03667 family PPOX class F420-dependent oxidoreductase [Chloroflexi bacterium AL-W]NOK92306.1 TIGR03667 family PPOX class F420-dependent oxidoreductase [Chloroflexi bacterium AL-N15]